MLGLQPVSITSPTNANCSVVYLGVLPQIVRRGIHRKGNISAQKLHAWMLKGVQASRVQL